MADGGEGSDGGGEATDSGSVEAPAGVPGKFWDSISGTVNNEAWGKSYGELEGKLRTQKNDLTKSLREQWDSERFANRPESIDDYQVNLPEGLELPEGIEWDVAEDDTMVSWWKDFVFEQGGDQAMFDKGLAMYLGAQMSKLPDVERDMEALGEYGQQRAERVQLWAQNTLSEDGMSNLTDMMTTAKGLEVMEELMEKMGEAPFSPQDSAYAGTDMPSESVLREKMNDERYWNPLKRDPAYVREIEEAFARIGEHEDKIAGR